MTKPARIKKLESDYRMKCGTIAGCGNYALEGASRTQVETIVGLLQEAKRKGLDWREIYRGVYDFWKDCRPLFPDPDAMAARIETPKKRT